MFIIIKPVYNYFTLFSCVCIFNTTICPMKKSTKINVIKKKKKLMNKPKNGLVNNITSAENIT